MLPKEWELFTLEELALVERGKFSARPRNDPKYYGGKTPFVQTGDVTSAGTYLLSYSQSLNEDGVKVSKIFPKDTILITIAANIGDTAITTFDVACPDSVVAIQPYNDKADVFWLKKTLETHKSELDSKATQNAQKNINLQVLRPLVIRTPPLGEQKKITKILSTWDKAIANVEKLITNSQQQKKALMQQLLTGKKRLPGFREEAKYQQTRYGLIPDDWGFVHIEDIAVQVSKKNIEALDLPVLSCSKYEGFVDSLQYFNKKVYSDDTSGYKVVERGCFGFPSNHIEEGSIGYQNLYDAGLVSPIYTVFKPNPKKVDSFYLYKLLKTEHYRQIFSAATNASVDRRGSLRWKEFGKIRIPLPTLPEQQQIASILSASEGEVGVLLQSLERLTQEKKALMQQLLTGKRRVTIN